MIYSLFIKHLAEFFDSVNFERLDDAVRARKALNGRDVLGSDVGAIRIGFAKVPVKNGPEGTGVPDDSPNLAVTGVGDLSVGATIHALRGVKGASTIPADQQVLGGNVENYRSNLLLSMIASGTHNAAHVSDGLAKPAGWTPSVTEQQMIMREISDGATDAEADIQSLSGLYKLVYTFLSISNSRHQSSVLLRCITRPFLSSLRDLIIEGGMLRSCAS